MSNPVTQIFRFMIREPQPREAADTLASEPVCDASASGSFASGSATAELTGRPDDLLSGSHSATRIAHADRPQRLRGGGPRRPLPPPTRTARLPAVTPVDRGPVLAAGLLLGAGLAGFAGQILHTLAALAVPVAPHPGDLALHACAWLAALLGVLALWRTRRHDDPTRSSAAFLGTVFFGAGLLGLLDGFIHLFFAAPHALAVTLARVSVAVGLVLALLGALCCRAARR